MRDTSWDRALVVTGDGKGLVGHAGGILLRKLADQTGLTAGLDAARAVRGTSPQFSRGTVLTSTAIAMGATPIATSRSWASWSRSPGRRPRGRKATASILSRGGASTPASAWT